MRYLNILFSNSPTFCTLFMTSCTEEAFAQLLLRSHKLCSAGCIVSRTLRVRNVSSPSPQSSPSGKRAARKLANGLHCGMHRGVLPILMISPLFFAHRFPPPTSDRNHEHLYFHLSDTMKSTAAIFASILGSAAAVPSKTPDLVMTNFAGTTCASPSVLTSAVATVSDTCTSRGRKRAR